MRDDRVAPVLLGTFHRSPGKVRPIPSRSTDFKHCSLDHYSCDTVEQQFTHSTSLGVKWCKLRDNEARVLPARLDHTGESAIVESTRDASVRVVVVSARGAPGAL